VLLLPQVALFMGCCGLVAADACDRMFGLSDEVKDVHGEEVRSGTVAGSICLSVCIVQLNFGCPGSCAMDGFGCGIAGRREDSDRCFADSIFEALETCVETGVNCLRRSATPIFASEVDSEEIDLG